MSDDVDEVSSNEEWIDEMTVDETGDFSTALQYEAQCGHDSLRGRRVATASYTPNMAAEIDAKNGWHTGQDRLRGGDDWLDDNMAASNALMAWIFENRHLDKTSGMQMAAERYAQLLRGRGYELEAKDLPKHLVFTDRELLYVDHVLAYCTKNTSIATIKGLQRSFVRYLAMTWMIRPQFLVGAEDDNKTLSLERLAKPLALTKCWLSMVAEQFGKDFGIQSRNQKRLSTRVNYSAATTKAWKKRKAVTSS